MRTIIIHVKGAGTLCPRMVARENNLKTIHDRNFHVIKYQNSTTYTKNKGGPIKMTDVMNDFILKVNCVTSQ